MVPFFGSQIKQNMNFKSTQPIFERYTGENTWQKPKREQAPLFKPVKNMTVNGFIQHDRELERYVTSNKRNNEFPIDKIRVGPGLNKGYGSEGSGGFHPDNRDILLKKYKSVDDLRVLTNPKKIYEGRIISGKKTDKRGQMKKFDKNKPDTFYKNSPARYNTSVVRTKNKQRPTILIKETNRKISKPFWGFAGATDNKKQKKRSKYRKSKKQNFETSGPRNLTSGDKWVDLNMADYGKKGIYIPPNEREITGKRTTIGNLTTVVKAIISPFVDTAQTTKKENFIANPRPTGNIKAREKLTVYDTNDIMRTTIKETTIENNNFGNMDIQAPRKLTLYDPNDIAKTTIKETTIDNNHLGHFSGNKKGVAYNDDEKARKTIKETNIHNTREGYVDISVKKPILPLDDIAKVTVKQTTIDNDHIGHYGSENKKPTVSPDDNMKTTMKETSIHGTREGYVDMPIKKPIVHDPDDLPKNTNKQFTADYEYSGIAGSINKKNMSYDDVYNATLNEVREGTLKGREPTTSNVSMAIGKDFINMAVNKKDGEKEIVRDTNVTRITNYMLEPQVCESTRNKDILDNNVENKRIDPSILDAFNSNPFSKPLDSIA